MTTRLGIGLIGTGKHGIRYARHIVRDLPELRLVAIARRDVEVGRSQAAELGCRACGDYRDLIAAPDVDAVVVVVPPTLHLEVVETAAAEGRPMLLEKPAAPSVEAGRRMLLAVRKAALPVMVAQTLRYNGVVRVLSEARSRIGRVHALRIAQYLEPSRPGWIDDPAISGGGVALHTGIHSFDLARLLSGLEAESVCCEMARVGTERTEDNFSAVVRMSGGVLASVAASRATASRGGAIELVGESGQLIGDHALNFVRIVQGAISTELSVPPPVSTVLATLKDFAAALRRGGPMPIPLEEGLRAVALVAACYRAAASRRAEPVEAVE
ncbi:MAG: Gfo/Idh/MocA family oxidoreductase [Deltaproteobacteria bacterium]|nr:Gfo/Idh/MocA family oxidoreductase [Deltaproteobacteria bacterium]